MSSVKRTLFEGLVTRESVALAERLSRDGGMAPYYRVQQQPIGGRMIVDGQPVIMLGSNDYLALRHDPRVIDAGVRALREFGSGGGGSRLMAGSVPAHRELEEELTDWTQREDAVVFTTGYQANMGMLSVLLDPRSVALCEASAHASLIDGVALAGATIRTFHRYALEGLRHRLRTMQGEARAVILDSVYSMDGDVVPLDAVVACLEECQAHDVAVVLDEAHAIGLFGPEGGGVATGTGAGRRVDLITGTLSKSLASCGGFVAGPAAIISAVRATARSLIFSTAGVPAALASALAAVRIARAEPERRSRALALADRLRNGLRQEGLNVGLSNSAIVPLIVGDEQLAMNVAGELFHRGVYAGVAIHPAVPKRRAILRFSVNAGLADDEIDYVIEVASDLVRAGLAPASPLGARL